MKRQVGIFSGTFDPVHAGHINFAKIALDDCHLDSIVFLPEQNPRTKVAVTPISHRRALLEHAIVGYDSFSVLQLESPQFTILSTLPELQQKFALIDSAVSVKLTFLFGSDVVLHSLAQWPDLKLLLQQASFVIGLRNETSRQQVIDVMTRIESEQGIKSHYKILSTPYARLTSTAVRSALHREGDVHPVVSSYIAEHRLYN